MPSSQAIEQIKSDESVGGKGNLFGHEVEGILHIGHGFNLERGDAEEVLLLAGVRPDKIKDVMKEGGEPLTTPQMETLFDITVEEAERNADNQFFNWTTLPQTVRDVLTNMSFQLGPGSLREFTEMKKAVENEDWEGMNREMLDSKWARQTPKRAKRLAQQVSTVRSNPISAPIPKSSLAQSFNASKAFKDDVQDRQAEELASLMSEDALVNEVADLITSNQVAEVEEAPEEKPKPALAKLERGLFEDESGKKFFVDDQDRLLELDENNEPRTVIDPSKFDLSKVAPQDTGDKVEEIF